MSGVGRRVSLPAARTIGAMLGALAWRAVPKERRKALRHLALAYPDLDDHARAEIARAMFRHLGISLLEITWLPNLNRETLLALTTIEGLENMQSAVDRGRGVVLFTGHCGNWEWMASAIGLSGFAMNTIARALYDPRLNEFIVRSRLQHNVRTIGRGTSSSGKEMLQTLRSGAILGMLVDQRIEAENAEIEFFGRPAPTPIGPAKIAIRSGAVAICGFIERRGAMQHLRFEPPIETHPDDDPVELTRRITRSIEAQIRRVPEQWVWMHKRW